MRKCLRCGADGVTRDHIVPRLVLRIMLGREQYARFCSEVRKHNIQPLCGPCNNWKATRIIDYRPRKQHDQLVDFLDKYGIRDDVEFEEPVWLVN